MTGFCGTWIYLDVEICSSDRSTMTNQLFSEGELADYLILRWERFIAAVNAARQDGGVNKLILEDHLLQIPELLPGSKIVEHGIVEQNPLLPAAVMLEVATESGVISVPHARSFVIIEIQFSGEADLFRYRPPDCPNVAPQGKVCGQALQLRYERSGSADKDWREIYLSDCKAIFDFLDLAEVCVKGFNERIKSTPPN
jgi:hypothetical protein